MGLRTSISSPCIPDRRVDEFILAAAAHHEASRAAIVDADTGRAITYGELPSSVGALASAFADAGIGPGDVVGVHLPNGVEFAVSILAAWAAGATITPVSTAATCAEVRAQLESTAATALVTCADFAAVWVHPAAARGLSADRIVVVGATDVELPPHTPYDVAAAHPQRALDVDVDPATHVACLTMSSGTTGLPKPVMLAHRALVANAVQFSEAVALPAGTTSLAFLPFSHIYGLTTGLVSGLGRGDTVVTLARFRLDAAMAAVAAHGVTLAFVVPPVAALLATHPDVDPDSLATLSTIISGAAYLDPTVAHAVCNRLGVEVLQGYGLSEMAPVTHVMRSGEDMPVDTVGTPLPGVECRVVDPESGRELPIPRVGRSGPGELLVRGPNAMLGYLDREEDTRRTIDADGWVHTGDLVTIDDRGLLRIVDRLKEVLKHRGFQVAPAELESLLRDYPGVADAAVTGVAGADPGDERPFALVVRTASVGAGPSEEGLMRYVADRTADYKHLTGVAFVPQLPRSDSGKILRRRLPELLPSGTTPSR